MCVFGLNMMLLRHGRGDKELQLASCPSGPTRLVGFDSFSQKRGEATRMFWKDQLPPCYSLLYQLAKMAPLAPRGADDIMPVECPAPLGVASGPSRRSLAQVGSGVGVCGYTRTRGFTRFRSAGTGRVRIGYTFYGSGRVRVWSWRVLVYPVFTRTNLTFSAY